MNHILPGNSETRLSMPFHVQKIETTEDILEYENLYNILWPDKKFKNKKDFLDMEVCIPEEHGFDKATDITQILPIKVKNYIDNSTDYIEELEDFLYRKLTFFEIEKYPIFKDISKPLQSKLDFLEKIKSNIQETVQEQIPSIKKEIMDKISKEQKGKKNISLRILLSKEKEKIHIQIQDREEIRAYILSEQKRIKKIINNNIENEWKNLPFSVKNEFSQHFENTIEKEIEKIEKLDRSQKEKLREHILHWFHTKLNKLFIEEEFVHRNNVVSYLSKIQKEFYHFLKIEIRNHFKLNGLFYTENEEQKFNAKKTNITTWVKENLEDTVSKWNNLEEKEKIQIKEENIYPVFENWANKNIINDQLNILEYLKNTLKEDLQNMYITTVKSVNNISNDILTNNKTAILKRGKNKKTTELKLDRTTHNYDLLTTIEEIKKLLKKAEDTGKIFDENMWNLLLSNQEIDVLSSEEADQLKKLYHKVIKILNEKKNHH